MSAVKIEINKFVDDKGNLKFKVIGDNSYDLYHHFNSKAEQSYFYFLDKGMYFFTLSNKIYKLSFAKIKFSTKIDFYDRHIIESTSIEDILLKAELLICSSLIQWNLNFALFIEKRRINSFENAVKKNDFYLNLFKEVKEDAIWYNQHRILYNENDLVEIEKLRQIYFEDNRHICDLEIEPKIEDVEEPKINLLDKVLGFSSLKIKKYDKKINDLNSRISQIKNRNESKSEVNKFKIEAKSNILRILDNRITKWKNEIENIDKVVNNYESKNDIKTFFNKSLDLSILNNLYEFNYNVAYKNELKGLICDVELPNNEEIINLKGYKEYKRDVKVTPILHNEKDYNKLYNDILYSVVFRIVNEIYSSDYNNVLELVHINGWLTAINKKNGNYERKCILTVSINKDKFSKLNLEQIDLKAAFKDFRGISAPNLMEFTAIAPIMSIEKTDKRFVQSVEVLKNIENSTNLATIDWEEFEHLVRELFEKEFTVNGGEVKVTQSSRDGGVDAVAFDPDPIRGGKIVIQSKRYTNVVGVSAVRDLYGTVMNEGATKGILVTTSHYGNDAYEFAKGKPITLLDGNNLLSLLEKHGYNARIDIIEAKQLNK